MTRSWPRVLCRGTTAVLAVLVLAQPVLAGGFLTGHYDLLRLHGLVAAGLFATSLVQAVVVVFLWRSGGPRGLMIAGLALPVLLGVQATLGENRVLAVHVPLGVLFVAGLIRLAATVWREPAAVPVAS